MESARIVSLLIELTGILAVNVGILISAFETSLPMRTRIMVVPVFASTGLAIWYFGVSIARMLS